MLNFSICKFSFVNRARVKYPSSSSRDVSNKASSSDKSSRNDQVFPGELEGFDKRPRGTKDCRRFFNTLCTNKKSTTLQNEQEGSLFSEFRGRRDDAKGSNSESVRMSGSVLEFDFSGEEKRFRVPTC